MFTLKHLKNILALPAFFSFFLFSCNQQNPQTSQVNYKDSSKHKLVSSNANGYILYLRDYLLGFSGQLAEIYFPQAENPQFPGCENIMDIYTYIHADNLFKKTFDNSFIENSLDACIASEQKKSHSDVLDALTILRIKYASGISTYSGRQIAQKFLESGDISLPLAAYLFLSDFYPVNDIVEKSSLNRGDELSLKNFASSLEQNICITDNFDQPVLVPALLFKNIQPNDETKNILRLMATDYCGSHLFLEGRYDDLILLAAYSPSFENLFHWRISVAILSQESIEYYQKYYEALKDIITPFNAEKIAYRQASPYDYDIVKNVVCPDKYVSTSWDENLTKPFDAIFSRWWLKNENPESLISDLNDLENSFGKKVEISLLKGSIALFNENPVAAIEYFGDSMRSCIYDPLAFENIRLVTQMMDEKNGKSNLLTFLKNKNQEKNSLSEDGKLELNVNGFIPGNDQLADSLTKNVTDKTSIWQPFFQVLNFLTSNESNSLSDEIAKEANLKGYIIGYDHLADSFKKIVADKTSIWRPFFGKLIEKGKRVIIKSAHIPLYLASRDLVDFPYQGDSRWGRAYYDEDLRSNGFTSGIAYENDIVVPLEGAVLRDLLVHEIAHHVHLQLFSPVLNACVEELFKNATEKNLFVSSYGSTNFKEYFAESMTAFSLDGEINNYLLPDAKYSKDFLKANDPHMYQFARSIIAANGNINKITCPKEVTL